MGFLDANSNLSQLFYLLCGHALCDYALQSDVMVNRKQPTFPSSPPDHYGSWWWWMSAHSLINGMWVGYVMRWWVLGALETLVHFGLDTLKAVGKITTTQDQAGHLLSKVLWMGLG